MPFIDRREILIRSAAASNPIVQGGVTIQDGDSVLVVLVKTASATDRAGGGLTLDGKPLTQAGTTQKAVTSPEASCELWYLLNPLPGTYSLTIPNTGAASVSYTTEAGTSPVGESAELEATIGSNGTSANPTSTAMTISRTGCIAWAVCASGITDFDPATPTHTGFGTGTGTPLGTFDDGANGGGQQYTLNPPVGSLTMGWTVGSDDWGCVAAAFRTIAAPKFQSHYGFRVGNGTSTTEKIR